MCKYAQKKVIVFLLVRFLQLVFSESMTCALDSLSVLENSGSVLVIGDKRRRTSSGKYKLDGNLLTPLLGENSGNDVHRCNESKISVRSELAEIHKAT